MIRHYKVPKKLSVVMFNYKTLPPEYHKDIPFGSKEHLIFIGEIPNMPGHCVVVDKSGRVHFGWDTDNFIQLKISET
jgi:hypothetical protein